MRLTIDIQQYYINNIKISTKEFTRDMVETHLYHRLNNQSEEDTLRNEGAVVGWSLR